MAAHLTALDHVLVHYLEYIFPVPYRAWCRAALDQHNSLPSRKRSSFDRYQREMDEVTARSGRWRPLDRSATALACIYAVYRQPKPDKDLPEDIAAAFAARGMTGAHAATGIRSDGWSFAMAWLRAFPEEFLGRMERLAQTSTPGRGIELRARPGSRAGDFDWLVFTLELVERLPRVPSPGPLEHERMTAGEFETLLDMAIRSRRMADVQSARGPERFVEAAAEWCPEITDAHLVRMMQDLLHLRPQTLRRIRSRGEAWNMVVARRPDYLIWREDKSSLLALRQAIKARRVYPEFTLEAGWHFDESGRRRRLVFEQCHQLEAADGTAEGAQAPIRMYVPREDHCPHCDSVLVNLFEIDLRNPRLAFLARSDAGEGTPAGAEALRIVACMNCVQIGGEDARVYSDVDFAGWTDVRRGRARQAEDIPSEPVDRPALQCVKLGAAVALAQQPAYGDMIGGLPRWEQSAEYPECPDCGQYMSFLAKAGCTPALYGFLCRECMVTVATSQFD